MFHHSSSPASQLHAQTPALELAGPDPIPHTQPKTLVAWPRWAVARVSCSFFVITLVRRFSVKCLLEYSVDVNDADVLHEIDEAAARESRVHV
jgi:hypothetical protein